MQVSQKDLEGFKKVFEMLNKAKYDGVDGNDVVTIYQSFVFLRQLEDRISKELQPKPVESPITTQASEAPAKKARKAK